MIEIKGLKKSFGENEVLRGVDLTIATGETVAIIGQSGCGKSVLLKHIIGLLEPDEGEVLVDGRHVAGLHNIELYLMRKRFGFLFQAAALFDSMTVYENLVLGPVEHGERDQAKLHALVKEKLGMVGLSGLENFKPAELSGGMRKRVGLARALITSPEYMLYDEPTTGLDPTMSDQIDSLIVNLTKRIQATSIVVTHDMFTVYEIAARVIMLSGGKVHFEGTPDELRASGDKTIRDFIGRYTQR